MLCSKASIYKVDRGVTLSEALLRHDKWLKKGDKECQFYCSYLVKLDCRVKLESECIFKKIRKPPYFNRIKEKVRDITVLSKRYGLT
nr:3'-5' exoribonuclease 1-like [Tanacetum cinerariifolium]